MSAAKKGIVSVKVPASPGYNLRRMLAPHTDETVFGARR